MLNYKDFLKILGIPPTRIPTFSGILEQYDEIYQTKKIKCCYVCKSEFSCNNRRALYRLCKFLNWKYYDPEPQLVEIFERDGIEIIKEGI